MPQPRRLGRALWLLLSLFLLRVIGQLFVALGLGRGVLPPMEEWHSGLLPYRFLLPAQILILAILGKVALDYTRGTGLAARPNRRLGSALLVFGSVYLGVMLLRYAIRMTLYPTERWTGGSIPIFLHWVLAAFLLLVGADQRRRGSPALFRRTWRSGLARWAGLLVVSLGVLFWVFLQLAPTLLATAIKARRSEYAVRVDRRVEMTTPDGVKLFARVYRPTRLPQAPTILIRMPLPSAPRSLFFADTIGRMWAERGYRTILQVTRGTPPSEGELYPLKHERSDGLATLAWLARDPHFDGGLGMWGGSSFGHTQWVLADQSDPGPRALFIWMAASDFRSMFHHAGAFSLESALYWAIRSRGPKDDPPDAATIDRGADGFPLLEADDRAVGDISFFNDWILHREPRGYWQAVGEENRPRELKAPVLLLAGWFDPFLPGQIRDFERIRREAAPEVARESRLVIGPWSHAQSERLADGFEPRNFRLESLAPALDWFDRHVRRESGVGATAPVRIFVMGENLWRDEDDWPLARAVPTTYYLRSGGDAGGPAARGRLETAPPGQADPPDVFLYDPTQPAPSAGGAMLSPRAGVSRQEAIEARPDVLSYTTAPLERDLEATGPISVTLYVTTSAPQTDFTAKLVDVHAGGAAYNVCDGILRRRYLERDAASGVSALMPITINLWPTSTLFRRGHRIRLEISSSNYPRFDRNPNTGGDPATETQPVSARQAVHHGSAAPSRLVLPLVPR